MVYFHTVLTKWQNGFDALFSIRNNCRESRIVDARNAVAAMLAVTAQNQKERGCPYSEWAKNG